MVKKIVIMLLNANPDIPATLGSPFFQATAAAALDLEVEVFFASRAASLLRKGVAENLYPGVQKAKSLYSFMQDAHQAGVKFYACGAALDENGIEEDTCIPELDDVRGGISFISAAVEEGVLTLTY
jgi:predicted peroxiredoxin